MHCSGSNLCASVTLPTKALKTSFFITQEEHALYAKSLDNQLPLGATVMSFHSGTRGGEASRRETAFTSGTVISGWDGATLSTTQTTRRLSNPFLNCSVNCKSLTYE